MPGPQFYGGPDLQRAGFQSSPVPAKILPTANQAPHKIEGLPRRLIEPLTQNHYILSYMNYTAYVFVVILHVVTLKCYTTKSTKLKIANDRKFLEFGRIIFRFRNKIRLHFIGGALLTPLILRRLRYVSLYIFNPNSKVACVIIVCCGICKYV